tara:strand:+ start:15465 stop:15815 length:351 start_codon:yes stop_codon:yes gene_type:complete
MEIKTFEQLLPLIVNKETIYHVNPYGCNKAAQVSVQAMELLGFNHDRLGISIVYNSEFSKDCETYYNDMFNPYDKMTFTTLAEAEEYINHIQQHGLPDDTVKHYYQCKQWESWLDV